MMVVELYVWPQPPRGPEWSDLVGSLTEPSVPETLVEPPSVDRLQCSGIIQMLQNLTGSIYSQTHWRSPVITTAGRREGWHLELEAILGYMGPCLKVKQ